MNSRDRRTYKRLLARAGVSLKPQQPKPKKVTEKRSILRRFLTLGKFLWTLVVAFPTLLSYVVLRPSIAIEPYASQDLRKPFAEQFYLQNNSVYDIREVVPRCGIGNVRTGNIRMGNFSVLNPSDVADNLAPGTKTTVTCILDRLFMDNPQSYGQLSITIWATYKIPLGFAGCRATNFSGKPVSDGTYIWTYRGALNCKDLDKPFFSN
jgi:hypothetical protein